MRADSRFIPSNISVEFSHHGFGWIRVALRSEGGGAEVTTYDDDDHIIRVALEEHPSQAAVFVFSSVFCPFHAFIAWLEAATTLVEICAFTWDPEGNDQKLEFYGPYLRLGCSYAEHDYECMVDRMQAVAAFYRGFRDFVISGRYRPERYENLTYGETIQLMLSGNFSLDEIAELLSVESGAVVDNLIDKAIGLPYMYEAKHSEVRDQAIHMIKPKHAEKETDGYSNLPAEWGDISKEERREFLLRLFSFSSGDRWGSDLRQLRSHIVENKIGWSEDTAS